MRIYVDADACPVVKETEQVAKKSGDVVVTQDYGVAAMALGKGAYAIHQNGWQYTVENIDRLLMERHMAKKARRAKKKVHLKGPDKRTRADNEKFADGLARLLEMARNSDGLV